MIGIRAVVACTGARLERRSCESLRELQGCGRRSRQEGERESSFANCVDMSNCGVDTYGCVTPLVGPATDPTMRRKKQSPVTRAALWQAPVHATTICIPITCAAAHNSQLTTHNCDEVARQAPVQRSRLSPLPSHPGFAGLFQTGWRNPGLYPVLWLSSGLWSRQS